VEWRVTVEQILPEGFGLDREDFTLRVSLPSVVRTRTHVLEPVLTRSDAERVAECVVEADLIADVTRIVLLRDPGCTPGTVVRFQERLVGLLLEGGMDVPVEVELCPAEPRGMRAGGREPAVLRPT
jgi:hypothetical protein